MSLRLRFFLLVFGHVDSVLLSVLSSSVIGFIKKKKKVKTKRDLLF